MNRKSRGKITLTYEEGRRCFETGKLATKMEHFLDDEYVRIAKATTYSKIIKLAEEARAKGGYVKAPEAHIFEERFYTEVAGMALQEGLYKSVKNGNLTNYEQDVASSLTSDLAVEVLTRMTTEFWLEVNGVPTDTSLNKIVEEAVQEAFTELFG